MKIKKHIGIQNIAFAILASTFTTTPANATSLTVHSGILNVTANGFAATYDDDGDFVPALPSMTDSLSLTTNASGHYFVEAINFIDFTPGGDFKTYASNSLDIGPSLIEFDSLVRGDSGPGYTDQYGTSSGEIDLTMHRDGVLTYSALGPNTGLKISSGSRGEIFTCGWDWDEPFCNEVTLLDYQLASDSYTLAYWLWNDSASDMSFDNRLSFSITATPVPLPASFWLFLSGITCITGRRFFRFNTN